MSITRRYREVGMFAERLKEQLFAIVKKKGLHVDVKEEKNQCHLQ